MVPCPERLPDTDPMNDTQAARRHRNVPDGVHTPSGGKFGGGNAVRNEAMP